MLSVGAFEAKNRLSSLLDIASKGGQIWITKRGQRVALLTAVPSQTETKSLDPVSIFRQIRSRSKRDKTSLKTLIEEGRK